MGRPRKNPLTVTNVCEQCGESFEIRYQKRHQRFCSKKCSNAFPETKSKIVEAQKKTFLENYGVEHPMKTEKTKKNLRKSMKKKYGVEHALQDKTLHNKARKTKLDKYGDENYNNLEQIKKTCMEKYGVDNIRKSDVYLEKYYVTCMNRHGVEHASKSKQYKDSHTYRMFEKFDKEEGFENFTNLFDKSEYKGVTEKFDRRYPFKCNRCGNISNYYISDGKRPECPECDRKYSRFQREVLLFLQDYDDSWVTNDRTQIKPLEIDIYSDKFKIGIECDSLYYHSEVSGKKNKIYHLNKNKLAAMRAGIHLIHIWDSEWIQKNDIVKSILLNNLNLTPNKIHGRQCMVKELTPKIANDFLCQSHIQGSDRSSIRLGLYYKGELVSVMTFCKSRFDKKIQYEMSRFCSKTYTSIIGGASKLFQHFIKNYNPKSIVSYSDRRYFSGEIYSKLGFKFVDNSPPNYYYITGNYLVTENRIRFQKHKLKEKLSSFDDSLSEWKNMKLNGFDRIWDCGNSKWIYFSKNN